MMTQSLKWKVKGYTKLLYIMYKELMNMFLHYRDAGYW